ncbi:class I SAM-dependent methyltransferase [Hyphobacterium sp.]|uniref:class I SAM-dependent methyltransferase n=1 Tax=Hyphobacterium sp. TaxID=2004662 RepID=UPI003BAA1CB1
MKSPVCPACGASEISDAAQKFTFNLDGVSVHDCLACNSAVMLPPPDKDYSQHTTQMTGIRNYVEMNCSIDGLVGYLGPAFEIWKPGTFMDIGCGFGFSLDIARRLTGAEVLGIEPAHYGRVGSEMLGVPILPKILTGTPQTQDDPRLQNPVDMIFSSEVIEHVSDPAALLQTIRSYLKPGGVAVITTPRAESLAEERSNSEKRAVISPWAHVFLYSHSAFEKAMREAGFEHVVIRTLGVTQIAYASDQPFNWTDVDIADLSLKYLRSAAGDHDPETIVGVGVAHRLFRLRVQSANWAEADTLARQLTFKSAPENLHFPDYPAFLEEYRACEASLAYHLAMLQMNAHRQFESASDEFLNAFRFCREVLRIAAGSSVVEADLYWLAIFHAALAAQYGGYKGKAPLIWQALEASLDDPNVPALPSALGERLRSDLSPLFQPQGELASRLGL